MAKDFSVKSHLDLLEDGIGGLVRIDVDDLAGAAEFEEAENGVSDSLVGVEPTVSCLHGIVIPLPQGIIVVVATAMRDRRLTQQVVDRATLTATPTGAETVD